MKKFFVFYQDGESSSFSVFDTADEATQWIIKHESSLTRSGLRSYHIVEGEALALPPGIPGGPR